jgi:hypothetical protein
MFRDESDHVISKARKPRSRKKGRTPEPTRSSSTSRLQREDAATTSSGYTSAATSGSPEIPEPVSRADGAQSVVLTEPPEASFKSLALLTPNSTVLKQYFDAPDADGPPDDSSLLPSPNEGTWPSTPLTTRDYKLSPSFQEQGTAFFFARYVTGGGNACHQSYDYIYDVWKPMSLLPERQVDGVMASMTAVGLAGLSALTKSHTMMDWARRSYGTALRLTNDALMSPTEAVKDSTLLSVLILGTYEMLTGRTPETMRAWQEHMNGAAALAKLRGKEQFNTRAGTRMFLMLCETVMISCIQRDIPMPESLIELRDALSKHFSPRDPTWRISTSIYKILQVRYDIKCGRIVHAGDIVDKLAAIEAEFAELVEGLPPEWHYRIVGMSQPSPIVYGMHCHVYSSALQATTWNGLRSVRMLVQETILGELFRTFKELNFEHIPAGHKVQFARSKILLERLRDGLLASIPQHFGIVSSRDTRAGTGEPPISMVIAKDPPYHVVSSPASTASSAPTTPSSIADSYNPTVLDPIAPSKTSHDGAERFMTLASARNTIVWPLYLLGVSSSCTQQIKRYVIQRLNAIFEENAVVQAQAIAGMLEGKDTASPWGELVLDEDPGATEDLYTMRV